MSNWLRSIFKLVSVDIQACFESHFVASGRLDHSQKVQHWGFIGQCYFITLKYFALLVLC